MMLQRKLSKRLQLALAEFGIVLQTHRGIPRNAVLIIPKPILSTLVSR